MKVKLAKLTLDFSLYPRHHVDEQTVNDYVHALKAGAEFPPIIADKKSNRVVDGFTRYTAHLHHFGEEGTIETEFRSYKTEADVLIDAIRCNTSHGQRISRYDMKRCVILCEEMKIDDEEIAIALNVTPERLDSIRGRIHTTKTGDRIAGKQVSTHLDEPLTAQQRQGVEHAGGGKQLFFVNQVINLIENKLLNRNDQRLLDRLSYLAQLITEKVSIAA